MLVKRKWVYIQQPNQYDIPGCCEGDYTWSEFVDLLWCYKCDKEFTPEHWGVFDGPIPINAVFLFGLNFTRVNIKTKRYARVGTKQYQKTRP